MGMRMEQRDERERERIEAVLKALKKQVPLTLKQEKFCTDACVERFLKAKGENVKKAAKHLRAVLSWRDSIGIDHIIADEFSAELADGTAYVAGHDDQSRPVVILRIHQDYARNHSKKSFVRLLIFTLEVAVSYIGRFVDQFVIIFDASLYRSAAAFLNLAMGTLKLVADYYPGRLHQAFVVDPPSLFPYLWKGIRPFVELAAAIAVVSSLDFEEPLEDNAYCLHHRTASLRFDPAAAAKATLGSASSRFSFTVSHMDSLKPWYLSTTDSRSAGMVITASSPSQLSGRSFSFASPAARRQCVPSTPPSLGVPKLTPRTPRPSFLQSPAALFSSLTREGSKGEAFAPYIRFLRRPYHEVAYRATMRPPLGGIISIVRSNISGKQRQKI